MLIFITPTYNEEKDIEELLKQTKEKMAAEGLNYKIIIVDDGSTDRTVELASLFKDRYKIPLEIYRNSKNKGPGEVFRSGFRVALAGTLVDEDIIITKEADNTSDLGILKDMIKKIHEGYDVVLASCYAKEGRVIGTTIDRVILSKGANLLLKFFFPIRDVNTYSSFYRAYKATSLKRVFDRYGERLIQENGFVCMVELLIKLNRWGRLKIAEVPMVLRADKRTGKSKMRIIKNIFGYLKIIIRLKIFPDF